MLFRVATASAAALTISFLVSCGGSKHSGTHASLPGTWQATPIVIDGDSKDWPSPYPSYDAKAMVAYATSNDSENLYITMETGDPQTQLKVLKQGMVVSIDTNGKKDPQFNINYPLQNEEDPLDMNDAALKAKHVTKTHALDRQLEKNVDKNLDAANQFSLDGFRDCNGGYMVTQSIPCGIKVIAKMDEYKELVWEAVVPFRAIYNRKYITAADAGRPISVCFAVKGFKQPKTTSGENNTNQQMGGGGMKGAMRGGSGPRPGDDPMQQLHESTKTWKQFGLAWHS